MGCEDEMTMPNFFVVGAQKAGTTSLYHYLDQHPEVFMCPAKEPFFFDHEIDSTGNLIQQRFGRRSLARKPRFASIQEYRSLFDGVGDEKAVGEATPLYIYAPGTAERIKHHVPEARIVAILRNPADRAYSAFLYALRLGIEPLTDFRRALQEEERRIRQNWHYVYRYRDRGLYYRQIKEYYEVFGSEKVGLWLYEDMREDPQAVSSSLFRFLGVDASFSPDTSSRHNAAKVPKNAASRVAIKAMNKVFPVAKKIFPSSSVRVREQWDFKVRQLVNNRILAEEPPPLDPALRTSLLEDYREDIFKLQDLIGRDLSLWLAADSTDYTQRN